MFRQIMVPTDIAHPAPLEPALRVAADLARLYGAAVTCVGIFDNVPTLMARTPEDSTRQLEAFVARHSARTGIEMAARALFIPDPGADLVPTLLEEIEITGTDLVVMATHMPGWADYLFSARGGAIAAHAPVSVFLVR